MRTMMRFYIALVCVLLAFTSGAAPANLNPHGWVRQRIELISGTKVICSMRVSGAPHYIYAFDTEQKQVAWKRPTDDYPKVFPGDEKSCYLIAGENLHQVDLKSGKSLRTVNLTKAFLPKIPPKILQDVRKNKDYPMTFSGLTSTRGELYLRREISSFSSPRLRRDASHWNLLNKETLAVTNKGGKEKLIGKMGSDLLLLSEEGVSNPLYLLSSHKKRDITQKLSSQYNRWLIHRPENFFSSEYDTRNSCNNWCLFGISDAKPDKNGGVFLKEPFSDVMLFNTEGQTVRITPSPAPDGHLAHWIMLDGCCIRYSILAVKHDLQKKLTLAEGSMWIELYNKKGELLKRRVFDKEIRSLKCGGSTSKGDLVIICLGENKLTEAQFHILNPSTLETVQACKISDLSGSKPFGSVHFQRNTDVLIAQAGKYALLEMDAPSKRHQVTLHAYDVYSGKPLWQHTENIIVKQAAPPAGFPQ